MSVSELRENSIADLLSELSQESVELIRQEIRLVLADVVAQGREVGTGAGLLGGAAALGVGAFGALTAGLIAALQRRPSRGALIVATLYGAGAAGLADTGLKRLGRVAPQLVETVQRDVKASADGARRGAKPAARGTRAKAATNGARGGAKPAARGTRAKASADGARGKAATNGAPRKKPAAKRTRAAAVRPA
jgi:hypothetical protein